MLQYIAPIIKPNSACDYHRVILPLKDMGYDFLNMSSNMDPELTRLVFFNRLPHQPFLHLLELKQKYGIKLVMDMDDYWELYPEHVLYKKWKENNTALQLVTAIRNSDAIIVTTSYLADKIKPLNSNVHVIPNALPFDTDQFVVNPHKEDSNICRFIYAAGASHKDDAKVVTPAIEMLKDSEKFRIILAGYSKDNKFTSQIWKDIEDSISLKRKIDYIRVYGKPLENYMDLYDLGDVAIAPLQYNEFNYCKSNLKILEAGCKYMPIITSECLPYLNKDDIPYIQTAFGKANWYYKMKNFIKNKAEITFWGMALGQHVREKYNLSKINQYRIQLFNHLIYT